jgi:hypothetical protein
MSIAEESLRITGLFEAELLVELMLRHWHHPLADDADYRIELIEYSAEALRLAVAGNVLIPGLPAAKMNLVAAVWYAEQSLSSVSPFESAADTPARVAWLNAVRHSLPSCFCDPELLS